LYALYVASGFSRTFSGQKEEQRCGDC
jgi:hypothetical protein